MYPLLLKPALKSYIWGGTRLIEEFGKHAEFEKIAESWELSCHKDGCNVIANGTYKDVSFPEYIRQEGSGVLGTRAGKFERFPVLIKLIDAKDRLSIQVHPDDQYAMKYEGEYGKTEMWYIVDCEPDASLIYGFKSQISKEEFKERIENGSLLEVCNQVPVKKGDVFFIQAGTLHAIGKGILVAEVQENSNSTYRVYDYGRKDKDGKERDLHIDKALEVTSLDRMEEEGEQTSKKLEQNAYKIQVLAECKYFKTAELEIRTQADMVALGDTFHSLLVLDGDAEIVYAREKIKVKKGDSIFVPAKMGAYSIQGTCRILFSQL